MKCALVAFAGFADAGKDEAARPLLEAGYWRVCFGDIIKTQLDPLIREHFGFSAFTEDRTQKERIRRVMEAWGEDNYSAICDAFFRDLEPPSVNTRLVRVREARLWTERGGIVVRVNRPGRTGATQWERDRLVELERGGFVSGSIENDGDIAGLQAKVREFFGL